MELHYQEARGCREWFTRTEAHRRREKRIQKNGHLSYKMPVLLHAL